MFRRMVRLIAGFLRLALPWIYRILRMMYFLAMTSLTSIWVGVPTAVSRISDHWIREATATGLPLGYHQALRTGAVIVASITLFLGWLVLASFTVFLLNFVI